MINTIFAEKSKMSGRFTTDNVRVGCTVLKVPTMKIKDLRTLEKNGYSAARIEILGKHQKTLVREVRGDIAELNPGAEIKFEDIFRPGDKVDVSGISKGKGFAGSVKRFGFAGGPRTHGQSDRERAPGSSGSTTTPGRVYKGKRRPGHMGVDKVTVKNMKVLEVDIEKKLIVLIGSVPGANNYTLLKLSKKI